MTAKYTKSGNSLGFPATPVKFREIFDYQQVHTIVKNRILSNLGRFRIRTHEMQHFIEKWDLLKNENVVA